MEILFLNLDPTDQKMESLDISVESQQTGIIIFMLLMASDMTFKKYLLLIHKEKT